LGDCPAFARSYSGDYLRSIIQHESGMECALVPGDSLDDRPSVFSNEECHFLRYLSCDNELRSLVHLFKSCDPDRVQDLLSLFEVRALHPHD